MLSEEDDKDPEPSGTHSYFHCLLHLSSNDTVKNPRGKRSQGRLTRVRPEVSCEGVPPSAGIATEGTFKRFLSRVQLDMPQQVALLGKRSSTLVTVEGPFTWKGKRRERAVERCMEPIIPRFVVSYIALRHHYQKTLKHQRLHFFCTVAKASNSDVILLLRGD